MHKSEFKEIESLLIKGYNQYKSLKANQRKRQFQKAQAIKCIRESSLSEEKKQEEISKLTKRKGSIFGRYY